MTKRGNEQRGIRNLGRVSQPVSLTRTARPADTRRRKTGWETRPTYIDDLPRNASGPRAPTLALHRTGLLLRRPGGARRLSPCAADDPLRPARELLLRPLQPTPARLAAPLPPV